MPDDQHEKPSKRYKRSNRSIVALPTELIEHCVSSLDPRDRKTCVAACKASKICNRVATPLLYEVLDTTSGNHAPAASRLQLLYRTLTEKPSLARFSTTLTHDLRPRPVSQDTRTALDDGSLWSAICERVNVSAEIYDSVRSWVEAADTVRLDDEPWPMLLFAICPNFRTLNLAGHPSLIQRMSVLRSIFTPEFAQIEAIPIPRTSLVYIEHVNRDNSEDSDKGLTTAMLSSITMFPRLRSLSLSSAWRWGKPYLHGGLTSNLETLRIERCDCRTDELVEVVQVCGKLKSLNVEYLSAEDAHRSFDWQSLGESLRTTCPRLETLRLDSWPEWSTKLTGETLEAVRDDDYTPNGYMQRARPGGLGDLKNLAALKSLTISENALRGTLGPDVCLDEHEQSLPGLAELLPTSLKQLTLVCGNEYILDKADHLHDPFVPGLDECIIVNSKKDHWYSKNDGEGGVDRQLQREQ